MNGLIGGLSWRSSVTDDWLLSPPANLMNKPKRLTAEQLADANKVAAKPGLYSYPRIFKALEDMTAHIHSIEQENVELKRKLIVSTLECVAINHGWLDEDGAIEFINAPNGGWFGIDKDGNSVTLLTFGQTQTLEAL